jgi:hypothetical protein
MGVWEALFLARRGRSLCPAWRQALPCTLARNENALVADLLRLVRPQCWRIVSADLSALFPSSKSNRDAFNRAGAQRPFLRRSSRPTRFSGLTGLVDGHLGPAARRPAAALAACRGARTRVGGRRSIIVRAFGGGELTCPSPVDDGNEGAKHTILVARNGVPLVIRTAGANASDHAHIIPVVLDFPRGTGKPGRPKEGPTSCTRTGTRTATRRGGSWRG